MAETVEGLAAIDERLKQMTLSADRFGSALSDALRSAVVEGRDLDDVLRRMMLQLSSQALDQALAPLSGLFGGLAGGLLAPLTGALAALVGGGGSGGGGSGGGGWGGGAGTGAGGAGESGARTTVVFNVSTPDAASFKRSEAQLGGMLARAIGRGRRGL